MSDKYVIITAGGSGKRMGSTTPKQFLLLNGLPVIMHSIQAFYRYSNNIGIIVVLPESSFDDWQKLCTKYQFDIPHRICQGGNTRFKSVYQGLQLAGKGLIAVHDAVRPLVSRKVIENCFTVAEVKGNAIPVVKMKDSIRKVESGRSITVNRTDLRSVQTPQVFKSDILMQAYQQDENQCFTDDASVVEAYGCKINLLEGEERNIKITSPEDMLIAEALLKVS
jgi:2-C-methyl-D-erythritol 4-phosphate cytidylyltransferase